MSVTLTLYKPNPNVTFLGDWWMQESENEMTKSFIRWLNGEDEDFDLHAFHMQQWSDKKEHDYINLTARKRLLKHYRGGLKSLSRLDKFTPKIFQSKVYFCKYIPVDTVVYWSGWFLKKKFFKKKYWTIYCTTRQEMTRFFNQYLDWRSVNGRACFQAMQDSWQDGMILEISW